MTRLLLVEDNETNRNMAVRMLQKIGYTVDAVVDGAAAVEAVRRTEYDAVLMDVQMPVMDGCTATRRIRELGLVGLPIIAMTAHALVGDRERCLESGMDDYLAKPITLQALRDKLAQWVGAPTVA